MANHLEPLAEGEKSVIIMERKIDTKFILSPFDAKELASWLNSHIQDYERLFREIKISGTQSSNVQQNESIHIAGYM